MKSSKSKGHSFDSQLCLNYTLGGAFESLVFLVYAAWTCFR